MAEPTLSKEKSANPGAAAANKGKGLLKPSTMAVEEAKAED